MKAPLQPASLFRTLTALILLMSASPAGALGDSYYSSNSLLANGYWIKIRTGKEGIHRITGAELRSWGFANPDMVSVFGYGSVTGAENRFTEDFPDDLIQAPMMHTESGDILFYSGCDHRASTVDGTGCTIERNYYDFSSYYFLTETAEAVTMRTCVCESEGEVSDWHYSLELIEREVQNPLQGGVYFHDRRLTQGDKADFSFGLTDMCPGTEGYLQFYTASGTDKGYKPVLELTPEEAAVVSPKSENLGPTPDPLYYSLSKGMARFSRPADGEFLTLTIGLPENFGGYYVAVDYVCAIYKRMNRLSSSGSLIMKTAKGMGRLSLSDTDPTVEVWDISDLKAPARLPLGPDGIVCLEDKVNTLVSFRTDAEFPSVSCVGIVRNQNLHSLPTPDMLIITTEYLRPQADELARIHSEKQGMDVAVVLQEEVLNEFSSGAKHPSALRRFVKMLYDRTPGKLRNLLLYGPAVWDTRAIQIPEAETVLSFESEILSAAADVNGNYCTDQYFGMLADDYRPQDINTTPLDINVGRIAALSRAGAHAYNIKVDKFISSGNRHSRDILMFSDTGDDFAHLDVVSELSDSLGRHMPYANISRADQDIFGPGEGCITTAKRFIEASLNQGLGFMAYTGHGSRKLLGTHRLLTIEDVRRSRYETFLLVLLAACQSFYVDDIADDIGKSLLTAEHGGAIGVIAAGRPVYSDKNRNLALAVSEEYASLQNGDSFGDVFRRSRNGMIARGMGTSEGTNLLCYNYGGDPAVPVGFPVGVVSDIVIDGISVADGDMKLPSLKSVNLKASVCSPGEVPLDGKAVITIYYPEYRKNIGEGARTVCISDRIFMRSSAEVKKGRLDCNLILPEPSETGCGYRIFIEAEDSRTGERAIGGYSGFSVRAPDASGGQYDPLALAAYMDSDNYGPDYRVGTDAVFNLTVRGSESNSLDLSEVPGAGLSLILDGRAVTNGVRNYTMDEDGTVRFSVLLRGLLPGVHALEYCVRDVFGENYRGHLSFTAALNPVKFTIRLSEDGPVRSSAVFEPDSGVDSCRGTLIIVDSRGNTVLRVEKVSLPYSWDLKDRSGAPVPDGRYRAWIIDDDSRDGRICEPLEFIVLR